MSFSNNYDDERASKRERERERERKQIETKNERQKNKKKKGKERKGKERKEGRKEGSPTLLAQDKFKARQCSGYLAKRKILQCTVLIFLEPVKLYTLRI